MLRGKFLAMTAYIKNKRSQVNNLMIHFKLLEKQEQVKTKISRWKEITKTRAEIETKRICKESMKHRSGSLKR
jgi:hypothetical protein